jgi:hypothetical protein
LDLLPFGGGLVIWGGTADILENFLQEDGTDYNPQNIKDRLINFVYLYNLGKYDYFTGKTKNILI